MDPSSLVAIPGDPADPSGVEACVADASDTHPKLGGRAGGGCCYFVCCRAGPGPDAHGDTNRGDFEKAMEVKALLTNAVA